MNECDWKQKRDFDGRLLTESWERSDGRFEVGSNKHTREKCNPYYVGECFSNDRNNFISTSNFRKRFSSLQAAIKAVDKKFPIGAKSERTG